MYRLFIILMALTWMLFPLAAARGHEPQVAEQVKPVEVPEHVAHQPTANPDRIVLTWSADPSRSVSATWRTDTSVQRAVAEIALATKGPEFRNHAAQLEATTSPFQSDLGAAHYHHVTFNQLKPETIYAYRVGDGVNWSEWIQYTTPSDQPKPFTFVYFGDAQNEVKSMWSRVIREAYRDAPRASFLLHAGDLINSADRDAEWGEWFYAGGFIHRMIPSVPSPGNHEYARVRNAQGESVGRELTRHWRTLFTLPENGPPSLAETTYWIDFQGTRIISLNSNEQLQEQVQWLEQVLSDNPNRWTILTFHHPIYSSAEGRDNAELRNLWQPVFDKYRVDLVLQGHDHTYARTELMTHQKNLPTGVTGRSDRGGTVYVVSVSGPKMYELGQRPFMRSSAENTQLYQIVSIDTDELQYEARTATGALYDAFTLRKRPGEPNELIEQEE